MSDPWLQWPVELRRSAQVLVDLALDEDIGDGDLTARHFAPAAARLEARLVAKETGRLAGLPLFFRIFSCVAARAEGRRLDAQQGLASDCPEILDAAAEGAVFAAGEVLARFSAPAGVMHSGERSALNFIQRLCGVSSATAAAVAASAGPAVLDTRKTTPGFRLLEKYAVRMGGGENHRMGLHDAIMVKDNHKDSLGGILAVMDRLPSLPPDLPLIIEVDNLAELAQILDHPAAGRVTRVLLDNFPPEAVERAVALREARGGGADFEISGNLRPEDLARSAYARVEAASLGSITHSAGALDLSLEIEAR